MKYLYIAMCLIFSLNLSAVEVFINKETGGIDHYVTDKKAVAINHKPQNPKKYPGRGSKQNQRKNNS